MWPGTPEDMIDHRIAGYSSALVVLIDTITCSGLNSGLLTNPGREAAGSLTGYHFNLCSDTYVCFIIYGRVLKGTTRSFHSGVALWRPLWTKVVVFTKTSHLTAAGVRQSAL